MEMHWREQFEAARDSFEGEVQSHRLMCRIYDKFVGPEQAHHNCLGCNFDDLADQILKFLEVAADNPTGFELQHLFAMYAQLLNSCWERISDVFKIISVPDGYRIRHFAPFLRIRRWANFFKHPKTFGWVVHHPKYVIEGSGEHKSLTADPTKVRVVDDEFLKKYYSADCETNAGKLRGEFKGFERNTVVVLPDVAQLTSSICGCLDHFVRIITENPIYVEILNEESTIENYFAAAPCDPEVTPPFHASPYTFSSASPAYYPGSGSQGSSSSCPT
jgi:hypothetical protein